MANLATFLSNVQGVDVLIRQEAVDLYKNVSVDARLHLESILVAFISEFKKGIKEIIVLPELDTNSPNTWSILYIPEELFDFSLVASSVVEFKLSVAEKIILHNFHPAEPNNYWIVAGLANYYMYNVFPEKPKEKMVVESLQYALRDEAIYRQTQALKDFKQQGYTQLMDSTMRKKGKISFSL